jgi:hypothetical protein
MSKTAVITWDEPAGCASPRGWLHVGGNCVGFYLDYGPGHYRTPHAEILDTINGPVERVWCRRGRECRECQPGDVLAVRYPNGPGTTPHDSRYFETTAEARKWTETGR